jgi:hypothetical protein
VAGIAITTTARNLDASFRDWCAHHLRLVDHIYLWLDDPDEARSVHLPRDRRVRVDSGSQTVCGTVHGNMMVRQNENANHALELCGRDKIDWLIHIDTDELIYPADRKTLERTLAAGIGHVTLLNHEVCAQWECGNPFRECHDFKLNGKLGFNLYDNGKAAVRVGPGVYAPDAHSFEGFRGKRVFSDDLAVLHYACPSYDRWLAKYNALGDFPDYWWDDPQFRITLSFHLKSRDVCRRARAEGDLELARRFWAKQVLALNEIEQLTREGKIGRFAPLGYAALTQASA